MVSEFFSPKPGPQRGPVFFRRVSATPGNATRGLGSLSTYFLQAAPTLAGRFSSWTPPQKQLSQNLTADVRDQASNMFATFSACFSFFGLHEGYLQMWQGVLISARL